MTEHNHCTECGAQLPDEAKFCPKCGTERTANVEAQTKKENEDFLGCLFSISIVILLFVFIWWLASGPSDSAPDPDADNSIEAYVICQMAIKKRLVSPTSADFPSTPDSYKRLGKLSNQKYKVKLHLDAQNTFGANVRSHWTCTTTKGKKDDGMWTINQLYSD